VTGSSRGSGRGIALKLATEGVTVGIRYFQNEWMNPEMPAALPLG
jgi:NAD(P)-dependent dehydrogenase (short-subunit alcohol dehydrogenase family)